MAAGQLTGQILSIDQLIFDRSKNWSKCYFVLFSRHQTFLGHCQEMKQPGTARTLLALPASAASSERNWSVWGIVHSKLRNRLGVTRAGKLVYIYHNLRLLKGMQTEVEEEDEEEDLSEPYDGEDEDVNMQDSQINNQAFSRYPDSD